MKFFDLHCDTLTKCMDTNRNIMSNDMHNSLSALLKFDMPCQIFAIYADDENVYDAYNYTKKAITFFNEQKQLYSDYITTFSNSPVHKKVNAMLSIEGGEAVESLEALEEFHLLGVRLMTLTWNRVNKIGSGALSGSNDGLTDFGKKVVRKMNEKKIIIDVSHINIKGFKDVANLSNKPFVATHSNCFSICNHPRNLQDWQIKEVIQSGGIIGLNLYPPFVAETENVSITRLLKHIEHFLNCGCENSLCLGCDFDGISTMPVELKGTMDMDKVYYLINKNFGGVADKIFFENAFRFFAQ